MLIKAVKPYRHPGFLNFKMPVYDAWVNSGAQIAKSHYPISLVHGVFYKYDFPSLWCTMDEARLRFVEPLSISFDTYPDYLFYEIIPMFWDCWPIHYDKVENWIRKHRVKTAIFTSSVEMNEIKSRIPSLNVIHCPEGISCAEYGEGKSLCERSIDLLEFGRGLKDLSSPIEGQTTIMQDVSRFKYVVTRANNQYLFPPDQLHSIMEDAKITVCLPKSITHPQKTGGVETLTQRYWEAMLSRMVIVGHCPKELYDLIGYNPVIELEEVANYGGLIGMLDNIDQFQSLVDKNRDAALKLGDWSKRIVLIQNNLKELGYNIL